MADSNYEFTEMPPAPVSIRWVILFYFIFLLSLPLPAVEGLESPSSAPGQPASCLSVLFQAPLVIAAMPLIILAEPGLIVLVCLPVFTTATLALPLLLSLNRRFGLISGLSIGLLSAIAVAFIPSTATGAKHIGYIVWWIAQFGLIASCGITLWRMSLETRTSFRHRSGTRT